MADYVTLMGAEQVSSAGYTMRDAAHEMQRAAGSLDYSLQAHQRFMDDWLQRFQGALDGFQEMLKTPVVIQNPTDSKYCDKPVNGHECALLAGHDGDCSEILF